MKYFKMSEKSQFWMETKVMFDFGEKVREKAAELFKEDTAEGEQIAVGEEIDKMLNESYEAFGMDPETANSAESRLPSYFYSRGGEGEIQGFMANGFFYFAVDSLPDGFEWPDGITEVTEDEYNDADNSCD